MTMHAILVIGSQLGKLSQNQFLTRYEHHVGILGSVLEILKPQKIDPSAEALKAEGLRSQTDRDR